MSLRMLGFWPTPIVLLFAVALAALAWWLYFRETKGIVARPLNWGLPTLRALAVFLIVITLAEPTVESEVREGTPSSVLFLIDGSESMSLTDVPSFPGASASKEDQDPRYVRAIQALAGEHSNKESRLHGGLIEDLRDRFDIRIARFKNERIQTLWDSTRELPELPAEDWRTAEWGNQTPLGTVLRSVTSAEFDRDAIDAARRFVVLLTDGQSNAGDSALQVAEQINDERLSIYTVGFGGSSSQNDLVLRSVSCADNFYREDTLTGTATVREVGDGLPYTLNIRYGDVTIWSSNLVSQNSSRREVPFSFPVAKVVDLVQAEAGTDVALSSIPLKLNASIVASGEASAENNAQDFFTSITGNTAKVLLIDGRSRWESRYLKNLFARDPAWELLAIVTQPGETVSDTVIRGGLSSNLRFPEKKTELLDFNLVILGDIAPSCLSPEFFGWLSEYVEFGGGLILIDGARENLRKIGHTNFQDLLPIEWTRTGSSSNLPAFAEPTPTGEQIDALSIETETAANLADVPAKWQDLPRLDFVSSVQPKVGAETLLKANDGLSATPLLITSRFGAGRVLFSATDETWRWRYQVADLLHSKIWNQLCRWIMRNPLSLEGTFLSLDTGKPAYTREEEIEIRCQLRDADGGLHSSDTVSALVREGEEVVRRVTLDEVPDIPGTYTARLQGLPTGDYSVQVEAAGFSREALKPRSRLTVLAEPSEEFQEMTCNTRLLQNIAERGGGEFFEESDIDALVEALRPLSGGKIRRQSTQIWQSYGWFFAAVILLVIEWFLRKRAGLI